VTFDLARTVDVVLVGGGEKCGVKKDDNSRDEGMNALKPGRPPVRETEIDDLCCCPLKPNDITDSVYRIAS